jgi:hypothetical protein
VSCCNSERMLNFLGPLSECNYCWCVQLNKGQQCISSTIMMQVDAWGLPVKEDRLEFRTMQRAVQLKPVRSTQVDWTFRARSRQLVGENPNSRENIMRCTLESLLGHPCPKQRPNFLRSPTTNRCLELDAYCAELRVACEFQGIQHDRYPNPVHTSHAQFLAQVERDRMKAAMCKEHGVCLLLVPHTVSRAGMTSFLKAQLQAHQIPIATEILHLNSTAPATCMQPKEPAQPVAA